MDNFDDILNMPYPNMQIEKDFPDKVLRAAQFAPFAALTGYDDAVTEKARLTEKKIELDEYEKEELNRKLSYIAKHMDEGQVFSVTYFAPDDKKDGGRYDTVTEIVVKIKEYENILVMNNGTEIPIADILTIGAEFEI